MGKRQKEILLTGYIGNNNLGDDLMMQQTIAWLLEHYPERKPALYISYRGRVKPASYDERVKRYDAHRFRLAVVKELYYRYRVLRRCACAIWVGGTCMADIGGDGFYRQFRHNIRKGIPFAYLGIGIDYLEDPEKINKVDELLRGCRFAGFRDEKSWRYAEDHIPDGCFRQTEDLVYLTLSREEKSELQEEQNETQNGRLLLSWRNLDHYMPWSREEEQMEELVRAVVWLQEQCGDIAVLPLDEHEDSGGNRILAEKLRRSCYLPVSYIDHRSAEEKKQLIARSNIYFCGRLHGVMLGEWYGVNVTAMSYSLKMDLFMQSIGRECDRIDVKEMKKEDLLAAFQNGSASLSGEMLEEKRKKARINYALLGQMLEEESLPQDGTKPQPPHRLGEKR